MIASIRVRPARIAALLAVVLPLCAQAHAADGAPSTAPAAAVEEPAAYRTSDYRAPVPATLKGARVVDSGTAKGLWEAKSAVFIDVYPRPPKPDKLPPNTVWRDPSRLTIEGGVWLPNVGYGVLAPPVEEYLVTRLESLTGKDKARAIVFYCAKDCWMSWNAAKRALTLGYTNVLWFPDGTDGWTDIALPLADVQPVP